MSQAQDMLQLARDMQEAQHGASELPWLGTLKLAGRPFPGALVTPADANVGLWALGDIDGSAVFVMVKIQRAQLTGLAPKRGNLFTSESRNTLYIRKIHDDLATPYTEFLCSCS